LCAPEKLEPGNRGERVSQGREIESVNRGKRVSQGRQGGRGLEPFTVADVEKEMPTNADMLCNGVDRAELALCPVLSVAARL